MIYDHIHEWFYNLDDVVYNYKSITALLELEAIGTALGVWIYSDGSNSIIFFPPKRSIL